MTDAWRSIRLTEFEHVVTGPTQSLLRVCGQAPMEHVRGPRPVLVIETGEEEARFHPLRAPEDRRGVIRAAYAVPTSLVTGSACWLETSSGARVELPAPVQGAGRLRDDELFADQLLPGPPLTEAQPPVSADPDIPTGAARADVSPAPVAGDAEAALRDAEGQIRSLAQKVTEREAAATARAESAERATQLAQSRVAALEAELAAEAPARESLREEIGELRSRRRSLEREMDQSRDQLRIMTFERDELERQAAAFDEVAVKARERAAAAEATNERTTSTLNELQVWRAELERRLAETTTELGALRARREADERELVRLRVAVEEERSEGGARANRAGSEGGDDEIVASQAEEIQRLAAELAELRSRAARGG